MILKITKSVLPKQQERDGYPTWIPHNMRSALADKFGLYLQHLKNVADTNKQTDRATLEGRKLVNASVILKCCLFIDIIDSTKISSVNTQYHNSSILLMVDHIDDMKLACHLLLRKFENRLISFWNFQDWKKLLADIVMEENGDVLYQGIKLTRFTFAKQAIKKNVST